MNAYKCDICGRYYTLPDPNGQKIDPVTGAAIGFVPTKISFSGGWGNELTTNPHDICQACVDRFGKFVEETRKESESAGNDPYPKEER